MDQSLPRFCRPQFIFSAMVLAEVVVFVSVLSVEPGGDFWRRIGLSTVFTQWVVITAAAALCALQPVLLRLPIIWAGLAAYGLVVLIMAVASLIAYALSQALGLGLIATHRSQLSFVATNTLLCAVVAALAGRYFYIQRQWQEQVKVQAQARVQALQARIRPHFLFNAMNLVASLVRRRPQEAERVIEDLSDLFRSALREIDDDSTLDQELQLVDSYLAIEQLRLGERLKVDAELEALPRHAATPPLLIQPLVENAVYHGIQRLPQGGVVTLRARCDERSWSLEISNPKPHEATPGGSGIALDNIRERLRLRYGGRARLEIDDQPERYRITLTAPLAKES